VLSRLGRLTLAQETGLSVADVAARADVVHKAGDVGAAIASGSFRRWA
jgi:4-hydroxy-3-polyprenylbenzoate decarboxylase